MPDDLDSVEMNLLYEFIDYIRNQTMLVATPEDLSLYRVYVPVDVEGAYEDLKDFAKATKRRVKDVMVLMPRIIEGKPIKLWNKKVEEELPDYVKNEIEKKDISKVKYSSNYNRFETWHHR